MNLVTIFAIVCVSSVLGFSINISNEESAISSSSFSGGHMIPNHIIQKSNRSICTAMNEKSEKDTCSYGCGNCVQFCNFYGYSWFCCDGGLCCCYVAQVACAAWASCQWNYCVPS